MTTPLRFNDALLIADRAFLPFQCVAWTAYDGTGIINISVVDRTNTRLLGRTQLSSQHYGDSAQLAKALSASREELTQKGVALAPWSMPV